jgi:hypothetical protein
MGYYIQCKENFNKAAQIIEDYGAVLLHDAEEAYKSFEQGNGVICVLHNGSFDAAGFCFSRKELDVFADALTNKTWLSMDRKKAEDLSGFSKYL